MDLSQMSDQDLDALLAKAQPKNNPSVKKPLEQMSDQELDAMLSKNSPQNEPLISKLGSAALAPLSYIGSKYDKYVTAPARAGVGKLQEGDAPGSVSAWWNQVGADPSKAPSGEDLAVKAGLSKEPLKKIDKSKEPAFLEEEKKKVLGPAYGRVKGQEDARVPLSPAQIGGGFLESAIDPGMFLGTEAAEPVLKGLASSTSGKLGRLAEKAAVNATGATGKQASAFADNAGRELLDRKLVKFADDPEKVAGRTAGAMDKANADIDSSLKGLQESGVKVDENDIYSTIRSKINDLKKDPSTVDLAGNLEKELNNMLVANEARGHSDIGILDAEKTKRGYNRKAGNWMDPEKGQAGKEMYQTYRKAVEDKALASNPALAKTFQEGKETYGLLSPIQEAAERRAATTSQSPLGGFLDVTSGVAGAAAAGPAGAALTPIARRIIAPRISSSGAVTADMLSKALTDIKDPQTKAFLGKILMDTQRPQGRQKR